MKSFNFRGFSFVVMATLVAIFHVGCGTVLGEKIEVPAGGGVVTFAYKSPGIQGSSDLESKLLKAFEGAGMMPTDFSVHKNTFDGITQIGYNNLKVDVSFVARVSDVHIIVKSRINGGSIKMYGKEQPSG